MWNRLSRSVLLALAMLLSSISLAAAQGVITFEPKWERVGPTKTMTFGGVRYTVWALKAGDIYVVRFVDPDGKLFEARADFTKGALLNGNTAIFPMLLAAADLFAPTPGEGVPEYVRKKEGLDSLPFGAWRIVWSMADRVFWYHVNLLKQYPWVLHAGGVRFRIVNFNHNGFELQPEGDPSVKKAYDKLKSGYIEPSFDSLEVARVFLAKWLLRLSVPVAGSVKVGKRTFKVVTRDEEGFWIVKVGNNLVACEPGQKGCERDIRKFVRENPHKIPAGMTHPKTLRVDGSVYRVIRYDWLDDTWIINVGGKKVPCGSTDPEKCKKKIREYLKNNSIEDSDDRKGPSDGEFVETVL